MAMGIGTSDGQYFEDGFDYQTDRAQKMQPGERLYVSPNDIRPVGITPPAAYKAPPPQVGDLLNRERAEDNVINPEGNFPKTEDNYHALTRDENEYTPDSLGDVLDAQRHGVTSQKIADHPDYDMDAWKKATGLQSLPEGQHYPDTYKLPNHMTFSDDSQYSGQNGEEGGHWNKNDEGKWDFTPGPSNLKYHSMDELKDYFKKVEPDATLNPPPDNTPHGFLNRLSMVNAVKGMLNPSTEEDKNLLTGFYNTVKNAFSLPGDVYGGKIDPSSQQGIERAADLAGLMVYGPAPVAGKMADGTLGSFAGVQSKALRPAQLDNLQDAYKMFSEGAHPDEIWNKTGWMKGIEGKWKYEINDSKATIDKDWFKKPEAIEPGTGSSFAHLDKVLDHPELYKAYPELKDIIVHSDPKYPKGEAGWDAAHKTIKLGPGTESNKGILLHEIQHIIQGEEGFARGGTPAKLGEEIKVGEPYQLKFEQAFKDFQQDSRARWDDINAKYKAKGAMGLSSDDLDHIAKFNKVNETYRKYKDAANTLAFDYYERLAGETEARNVQRRELLSESERRRMTPQATQDRPTEKQINVPEGAWATAYGVQHPVTGEMINPSSVSDFRRAANDNFPEGHPDRPYNVREPGMIGDAEADKRLEENWKKISKRMEVDNQINKLMQKYPHTELDRARLAKLRKQADDLWKW